MIFSPTYFTKSTTLQEYPHSLSYHANTFTLRSPITIVDRPSIMEECGFVLKSMDTSGSVVKSNIPFKGPMDAVMNASLISSIVTSRSTSTTKSTNETLGVGTRNAIPCNFPFNSGNTSDNAFAAPVEVGIMDCAQALAL